MATTQRIVGAPVGRSDGPDKVTGKGKYGLDVVLPGTLWCKVLRSPYPHARVRRIDASKALALPGVHAVLTPDEVKGLRTGKRQIDEPILAFDAARYIGDKVAAVAADDEDIAQAALDLIEVEYEELPAVFTADQARRPDAPILHPDFNSYGGIQAKQEKPSNIFARGHWGKGNVADGFADADVIVERVYTTPRTHQAYLEVHNTIVWLDEDGQVQVWLGSKSPFANKASLSSVTGVPPEKITVNFAYVGGDFGGKGDITGVPICYFLAKKTGRPVKLTMEYSEELQAMNPRHESWMRVKAGVKRDGTLTAWEAEVYFNSGAYGAYKPVPGSNLPGIAEICGPYKVPHVSIDAYQVYTNTVPCGFHRSPGEVQGIFAGESHMDVIAKELGIDPVELRIKNIIHDGDETPVGHHFKDVKAEDVLREAVRASGFYDPKPKNVGRGIAIGHRTQGGGETHVSILVNADGTVTARNSIFDPGMGTHTIIQQVVAEEMGVSIDRVKIVPYDTDDVPFDTGVGGSRGSYVVTQASHGAAEDVKAKLKKLAAEFEGWDEEVVEFEAGHLVNTRTNRRIPMEKIAERAGEPVSGAGHIQENTPNPYTSFVAQVAEVEVDPETGVPHVKKITAVHDVARILNPIGFHGQLEGGLINAYGFAMMEELTMDEGGRITNPSFADFKIPTERDIPELVVSFVETIEGRGEYKVKAIGEHSNLTTAPAIASAIEDAVGVRLYSLPLTSEKVYRALQENGRR
jgi:CO/xanthine dehydrogenase Mo-binding subunit